MKHGKVKSVVGFVLVGMLCLGSGTAIAQSEPVPIRIGWQASAVGVFFVARNAELFEKHSLQPTYTKFAAGPQMFAALQSDSIDVVGFGASPFVAGIANGLEITGILGSYNDSKVNLLVTQPDSDIQKISDLKGKKVAAAKGSLSYLGLVAGLQQNGMTLSDVEYLNMSGTNIISAFQNEDVEAAWVWEPLAQKLIEEEDAKPVSSLADVNVGGDVWAARKDWIEEYPDGAIRFIAAMDEAARMIQADPGLATKDVAEALSISEALTEEIMSGVDSPTVKEQLDPESKHSVLFFDSGEKGLAASVKLTSEIFLDQGIIEAFPPINEVFDDRHIMKYAKNNNIIE